MEYYPLGQASRELCVFSGVLLRQYLKGFVSCWGKVIVAGQLVWKQAISTLS